MGLVDSIIGAESGGDPNARNPNSSASGPGQFLDSTFLDTIKAARPDLAQGKSDQELLALKTDPEIGRQMTEAYAAQNQATLSKAGLPVTPGSTYLAHFAGPGGAVKLLQADPNASAGDILGPAVVKANPFLAGMTAKDVQAWADRKMGGNAPPQQTAQASPAAPPSAPLNLIPQQAPPIFAQQAAPQQAQAQPSPIDQIPPMQQAPIFFAPRRSPDISKLRAAFAPPVFKRG
jgi:hypothetical protein